MTEPDPSRTRRGAWIALGLLLLAAAALRVRLLDLPLERDEGEYAYGGQLLLAGVPPYAGEYTMKPPGVHAAYAVAMALLGETARAIRIALLLASSATTVLVFLLARRWFDARAALAAAAAFAAFTLSPSAHGVFANAEHFVLPFAVGGFLALDRALRNGRLRGFVAAGLLFGLGVLMKQIGAAFLVAGAVFVAWEDPSRRGLGRIAALIGSSVAVGAALVVVLAAAGTLGTFWFWASTYSRAYAGTIPLGDVPGVLAMAIPIVLGDLRLLAALGLAGLAATFLVSELRARAPRLLPLAALSCAAVSVGGYFRPHYFLLLGPALALLAGALVFASRGAKVPLRTGVMLLVAAACLEPVVAQRDLLFELPLDRVVRALQGPENPFADAGAVSELVRERTSEDDRIAIFGSEPEILFLSRRRSATGHVYMYPLMEPQPFARRMQEELIREVESARPEVVVYVHGSPSWLRRPESEPRIFKWMATFLLGYRLEAMVIPRESGREIRVGDDLALPPPPPEATRVEIYRRP